MLSRKVLVIALAAVASHVQIAAAEPLPDALRRVLQEHALMNVVDNDVEAARGQVSVERSAWFPRLNVRNAIGHQDVDRDVGTSGKFDPSEMTFGVSQLLWDFGATNAAIHRAQENLAKETQEHEAQRQNLLLAGVEAHLKLLRAQQVLEYALQSEEKIKKQTQLEDIRVQTGAGYTTDVLQAKAQLAGAQARRVYAEGQLQTAVNRYRAVFGAHEHVPQVLDRVRLPSAQVPNSLEEVMQALPENNVDILVANSRAALTQAERDALRAREYMPRIELVMEHSSKREYDGIAGDRDDKRAMVQATWSFDFGMRQLSSVRAADHAALSEKAKARYVTLQAQEEANNAWADLATAKQRSAFLRDQVQLATRFVDLARKERELGRRSLLDVLNGETNLINAQSDAAAAETDEVLAAFRVLRAVGTLDVGAVSTEPRQAAFVRPAVEKAAANVTPQADRS